MISSKVSNIRLFVSLFFLCIAIKSYAFGTLFTSPQERVSFDLQRSTGNVLPNKPRTPIPSNHTKKQEKIFFNGYVIRNSGPDTAWVNDKDLSNNNSQISAKLNQIKGTLVPIKPSVSSKTIRLQPGQSLNLETREITESYLEKQPVPPANNATKITSPDQTHSKWPQDTELEQQAEKSENDI
jgi:hypothetical protein